MSSAILAPFRLFVSPRAVFRECREGRHLVVAHVTLLAVILVSALLDLNVWWPDARRFQALLHVHGLKETGIFLLFVALYHGAATLAGFRVGFRSLWTASCLILVIRLAGHLATHGLGWASRSAGLERNLAATLSLPALVNLWFVGLWILAARASTRAAEREFSSRNPATAFLGLLIYPIDGVRAAAQGRLERQATWVAAASVLLLAAAAALGETLAAAALMYGVWVAMILIGARRRRGAPQTRAAGRTMLGLLMGLLPLGYGLMRVFYALDRHVAALHLAAIAPWVLWAVAVIGTLIALLFLAVGWDLPVLPAGLRADVANATRWNAFRAAAGAGASVLDAVHLRADALTARWYVVYPPFVVATFIASQWMVDALAAYLGLSFSLGISASLWIACLLVAAAAAVSISYLLWAPLTWSGRPPRRDVLLRSFIWTLSAGVLTAWLLTDVLGGLYDARVRSALVIVAAAGFSLLFVLLVWRASDLGAAAFSLYALAGAALGGLVFFAPLAILAGPGWPAVKSLAAPACLAALLVLLFSARPWQGLRSRGPAAAVAALTIFTAGALANWFYTPNLLYRRFCLSPTIILGVDGTGGALAKNRSGDVFWGTPEKGWMTRLDLPRGARLGRARRSPSGDFYALEFRSSGDRFWRVAPSGRAQVIDLKGGRREIFFVADFDIDADGNLLIADALTWRLIRADADGKIQSAVVTPAAAGAPRLVSAAGNRICVVTATDRALWFGSDLSLESEMAMPERKDRGEAVDLIADEDGLLVVNAAAPERTALIRVRPDGTAGESVNFDRRIEAFGVDRSLRCFLADAGSVAVVDAKTGGRTATISAPALARRLFDRSPVQPFLSRLAGRNL